jgi:dTDP-4-amino-4,6-dideoxygalactose transaminase
VVRHSSSRVVFEDYPVAGFNYRMTDLQAAVGREQLKRLPQIVGRRRALAQQYGRLLEAVDGAHAPQEPHFARSNWQSYCVRLDTDVDQRSVMQHMLDNAVATRRGIMCIHLEAAHADLAVRHSLARSEQARDHSIILPLFPQMNEDVQEQVVSALGAAIEQSRGSARARLRAG